jgi:hypothetical protein
MKLVRAVKQSVLLLFIAPCAAGGELDLTLLGEVQLSQGFSVVRVCEWRDGRRLAFLFDGGVDVIEGEKAKALESRHNSVWLDVSCSNNAVLAVRPDGVYRWGKKGAPTKIYGGTEIRYAALDGDRALLVRSRKVASLCENGNCRDFSLRDMELIQPLFIDGRPVLISRKRSDSWIMTVTSEGLVPIELGVDLPLVDMGLLGASGGNMALLKPVGDGYELRYYRRLDGKLSLAWKGPIEGEPSFVSPLADGMLAIGGVGTLKKTQYGVLRSPLLNICGEFDGTSACKKVTLKSPEEGELTDSPGFFSISQLHDGVLGIGGFRDCQACVPSVYFVKQK